jgi:hypothetical protein
MEERLNHYELAASDAEAAWQHSHQSDVSGRRLAMQQAQRLVQYSLREQEAAQRGGRAAQAFGRGCGEDDAAGRCPPHAAVSKSCRSAVQMRDRFTEERVTAERKFSETLAGLANASEEIRVQKEFIRTLEGHCANVAQDNRRVESVAAEFYEEARRVHGLLPSLHSELHGLMSARGALCGDLGTSRQPAPRV